MPQQYIAQTVLLSTFGWVFIGLPVHADVIPNGLGTTVDNTGCAATCTITGGTVPAGGTNLYHSFQEFSIPATGTATLQHAATIENIFLRVTDLQSEIYGRLQTDVGGGALGNASIFLLNPYGVIFGPNASLNIGGSFIASTAESVRFQDGTEFRVTDSNPLLTISTPVGLQLGNSSGRIDVGTATNPGLGNQLYLNPNYSINRTLRPNGLSVANNRTLALVGQDISMVGSNLTAPQGRIELGSVRGPALVNLQTTGMGWQLDYSNVSAFGDINLSNAASIDVSGTSGGTIQAVGRTMNLSEGSAIISETLGNGTGGLLNVQAETINLFGISAFTPPAAPFPGLPPNVPMQTGIFADVATAQAGTGGNIAIDTQNLTLTDGAQVTAVTFGSGAGGNLTVNAKNISAVGSSDFGPSALLTAVAPPGPIYLPGPPFVVGAQPATGPGGNLVVNTGTLSLQAGGQIYSSSFGFGDAGSLTVNADTIEISGGSPGGPSSLQSAAEVPVAGAGNANTVSVNTRRLRLSDGGQISTATGGPGNAGNVFVNASETVEITGGAAFGRSGLFSSAISRTGFPPGTGSGGSVTINTPQLEIRDGGTISVSNFPSTANPALAAGTGLAGSINLTASKIILADSSRLSAESNYSGSGNGGANINVQADALVLRRTSQINANAQGTATGGNITLNTTALIALENSDITANAVDNFGGRVVVNAQTILGTAYREFLTPESDITASSALGPQFSGTVEINSPQVDPSQGLDELSEGLAASDQVTAACQQGAGNTFVASGSGGLPEDAGQMLRGSSVWRDLRLAEVTAPAVASTAEISVDGEAGPTLSIDTSIVEAQEVVIDAQGKVRLLPQSSNGFAWASHHHCLGG